MEEILIFPAKLGTAQVSLSGGRQYVHNLQNEPASSLNYVKIIRTLQVIRIVNDAAVEPRVPDVTKPLIVRQSLA
jgi:hypothetical protein